METLHSSALLEREEEGFVPESITGLGATSLEDGLLEAVEEEFDEANTLISPEFEGEAQPDIPEEVPPIKITVLETVIPKPKPVSEVPKKISKKASQLSFHKPNIETLPWAAEAKCLHAEPDTFFPEKGGSTRESKKICTGCPVRDECLEVALANDERFGIWGGLSERERRKLKRLAS